MRGTEATLWPMHLESFLRRYDRRLPRYTSYPTTPYFTPRVNAATYAAWLAQVPAEAGLSLYLHVPFCDRLCLFCGCHTSVVHAAAPKRAYAALLRQEISMVATALKERRRVRHVQWGGGTPTTLPADELIAVTQALRDHFALDEAAEISIEIDPVHLPPDRSAALAAMGVNRVSVGVQDLNERVLEAIGRHQSEEEIASAITGLRQAGIGSINLDLIYGLPQQTVEGVAETAQRVLALGAERLAVFGYAHVPWLKRHQALLEERALPDTFARYAQRQAIDLNLRAGGYVAIGLDHYAKPGDALALAARNERLKRNFQGYTTDEAAVLIGFGASAIGTLPQGYAQNAARVPEYAAILHQGLLPTVRGVALSAEDRLRREVIETLMCRLQADVAAIARRFGSADWSWPEDPQALEPFIADGLVRWDGARLTVTEAGRPFLRHIAALFDAYLPAGEQCHSAGL